MQYVKVDGRDSPAGAPVKKSEGKEVKPVHLLKVLSIEVPADIPAKNSEGKVVKPVQL